MAINILDQSYKPDIQELGESISGELSKVWCETACFIEESFKAKPQIDYSTCSGKPGWNLKYKKSSKALCTLYPETDFFIILIVLGTKEREQFDVMQEDFCDYIKDLYDGARLFNNTKWLMINVTNPIILDDVKKLLELKVKKQ